MRAERSAMVVSLDNDMALARIAGGDATAHRLACHGVARTQGFQGRSMFRICLLLSSLKGGYAHRGIGLMQYYDIGAELAL
ncbi:hypothetical protein XI08_30935 [Bradyrhizobium sp. CCBAU 11361]|nr:hypothetical protein [Bradyrhizobium sp. CCBAU 11361]